MIQHCRRNTSSIKPKPLRKSKQIIKVINHLERHLDYQFRSRFLRDSTEIAKGNSYLTKNCKIDAGFNEIKKFTNELLAFKLIDDKKNELCEKLDFFVDFSSYMLDAHKDSEFFGTILIDLSGLVTLDTYKNNLLSILQLQDFLEQTSLGIYLEN